jgi:spectinomycin phosphotransferase
MLEKPDLADELLIHCLADAYDIHVTELTFLALGADPNTAVYRAIADDATPYFVKLRSGRFHEMSVVLPRWLSDQGIVQIITPLAARTGRLWATFDRYTVILYPFVEGKDGYTVPMTDQHWHEFGMVMKRLHTAPISPQMTQQIPREAYNPTGRETIKRFLSRLDEPPIDDPIAIELTAFLKEKHDAIIELIELTERHAAVLKSRTPEFVVCHSDVHAGNILIDGAGRFYIVDWDDPILAWKERDLMFVGGGQGFRGHTLEEEVELFYQAYGPTSIDPHALAYYRYERIIQDIYVYCEQLLLSTEGGEDRAPSLYYLKSNFSPNGTIAVAYAADTTLSRQ